MQKGAVFFFRSLIKFTNFWLDSLEKKEKTNEIRDGRGEITTDMAEMK